MEAGSPTYLALVPSGNIPALVDGNLTLTDSEAIAEYLEEKYPEIPMLPDTLVGRARSRERSRFSDTRLEPALRLTFPYVDPEMRDAAAISIAHTQINLRLHGLGIMLQQSELPRDRLWMGDLGTIVTLEWIALFEGTVVPKLEWPAAVQIYRSDMLKHPSRCQRTRHVSACDAPLHARKRCAFVGETWAAVTGAQKETSVD